VLGGAGLLAVVFTVSRDAGRVVEPSFYGWFLAYVVFMWVICSLACVVPVRRIFAIHPSEALRDH